MTDIDLTHTASLLEAIYGALAALGILFGAPSLWGAVRSLSLIRRQRLNGDLLLVARGSVIGEVLRLAALISTLLVGWSALTVPTTGNPQAILSFRGGLVVVCGTILFNSILSWYVRRQMLREVG